MESGSNRLTVTFLGVRGSHPAAGARFAAYGGNSACVGISLGDAHAILDAGTGIANAPEAFWKGGSSHIFLSHLHHDHISGLMFYGAFYEAGCEVTLHVPAGGEGALKAYWSAPFFPIPLGETPASIRIVPVTDGGRVVVGGKGASDGARAGSPGDGSITVEAMAFSGDVHPKRGVTVYRVSGGGRRIVYATDVELAGEESKLTVARFARDADMLILDAHFSAEEYEAYSGWGHNSIEMALEVGAMSNCRRLVLFHHHPHRSDVEMNAFEEAAKSRMGNVTAAREGERVVL